MSSATNERHVIPMVDRYRWIRPDKGDIAIGSQKTAWGCHGRALDHDGPREFIRVEQYVDRNDRIAEDAYQL